MADTLFKAPRTRKSPRQDDYEPPPSSHSGKRPRTSEDFLLFCKFILEHENYEMQKHEELRSKANSPIGSTGSESAKSETPSSNSGEERKVSSDSDSDDGDIDDGYNTVTCYCGKPFAGRPMIECSHCLTWIHLSCARIRRTNIPDEFICAKCREKGVTQLTNQS
ncbi:PHD finger protein 23-like [Daphnia pulex]|uniref:Zinc finger PHD-type domain-containing protein n=2 Tax=Daphnia TaxID=6668 RepID=E9GTR2_DAPPU|nr:PHD finger protein 23-like [Daphnia pulex]XP_046643040.1 PHD finger protein 23-like [Daphnia pulicaria]EFX77123.1 hypothetical protein DAPPUDRAFT_305879 [Daphnia pulex]CAH0113040.1 unnamed protein product [Daphnia galeata]|eukprot:EFX77123.1 hypothetical protein DAPPUDRAFT_305879 [Daphnia pulex]